MSLYDKSSGNNFNCSIDLMGSRIIEKKGFKITKMVLGVESPKGIPTQFFGLAEDATGQILVIRAPYQSKFVPKEWESVSDLLETNLRDFSIVFDGQWDFIQGAWRLVTKPNPFIFLVDENGVLSTRLLYDERRGQVLATGVDSVTSVRTWRSATTGSRDFGVVVGYVSNNSLYYRAFCEQPSGRVIWEDIREVNYLKGKVKSANLFLTGDFRTGFSVGDIYGDVHWILTDRNWSGMMTIPEEISFYTASMILPTEIKTIQLEVEPISDTFFFFSADQRMIYGGSTNRFARAENFPDENGDWGRLVRVYTSYDLYIQDTVFTITDKNGEKQESTMAYYEEPNKIVICFQNLNNFNPSVNISCDGGKNGFFEQVSPFSIDFTLKNLNPFYVEPPVPISIWNEGDRNIYIRFDKELFNNPGPSGFIISSQGYKDTREIELIVDHHTIESGIPIDSFTLKFQLVPEKRLRRAEKVIVSYSSISGNLTGQTTPVENFTIDFIPTLDLKILDPYVAEAVNFSVNYFMESIAVEIYNTQLVTSIPFSLDFTVAFLTLEEMEV